MLAVAALVDIAERAAAGPVPATLDLRALLGVVWCLAGAKDDQRWLYDQFWRAVTGRREGRTNEFLDSYARHNEATIAIRGITRGLGLPDTATFDDEVRGAVHRLRARALSRVD